MIQQAIQHLIDGQHLSSEEAYETLAEVMRGEASEAQIGALLVAFHVWLFGSQLWDGQLVDLALGVRWLIAAGLVAALANLRRRGLSVVWGRHAVALWVLAALLMVALAAVLDQGRTQP